MILEQLLWIKQWLHCEEDERGRISLLIPVQAIEIRELKLEQRIVDTESHIAKYQQLQQIKPHKLLNGRKMTKRIQKPNRLHKDRNLSNNNHQCKQDQQDGKKRDEDSLNPAMPDPLHIVQHFVAVMVEDGRFDAPF